MAMTMSDYPCGLAAAVPIARASRWHGFHANRSGAPTAEWATPPEFFRKLDRRYQFTLDPCATPENAKCAVFFTREIDGLAQDWGTHRVFCNPPYGREIGKWARKCWEASQRGALVVLLAPAKTDTRWFQDWVNGKAKVTFVRGRLRFGDAAFGAPFASMVAVYLPYRHATLICARCGKPFVARGDARTCSNACRQGAYRERKRYT
jgi:site-specific DNA-methyltransferase (adenine-specific)